MKMKASADNAVCIAYKPSGTIRHTVYMFASPHCPYCARMLAEIKPVLDANNSELKVLFSVAGPDRDAAIEATCKKLNLDTYNTRTWESKDVKDRMSCTDGIKVVDEATALSYKLGIASLPTFFLETGQCIWKRH
jgi:protein-disulfide isomerase